jgi:ATP-binding cassette, subfamily C, bacterial CydC
LLDEPTAGLDPRQADQLIADVLGAAQDRSVLLITHRAAEAARCHTTVVLDAGHTVSPKDIPAFPDHRSG